MSQPRSQKPNYGAELLWTVGSVLLPVGWAELSPLMDFSPAAHAYVGWATWLVPFLLLLRMCWQYLGQRMWTAYLRTPVILLALAAFGYGALESISFVIRPTYIYLVPTVELIECQKRAFFLQLVGSHVQSNVDIVVRDNKSGKTYSESFSEVDPAPRASRQYLWVAPSSPWDEDYTATVTAREARSSQHLILRTKQQSVQFATQVTVDDEKKPTMTCRDKLLPDSYTLVGREAQSCDGLMKLPADTLAAFEWYSLQRPNGSLTIGKLRQLPSPSELDSQSDNRHVTEYQEQILGPILKRHAGAKLVIFFAGGQKSQAYAKEVRDLFRSKLWKVAEPTFVPVGDERIIDVQISVRDDGSSAKITDLLDGLEHAGIKHRRRFVIDTAIAEGVTVLWVGPKSPKDASPDQCSPAELKPQPGQHHTCDMIAQTQEMCPFVPE